MHQDIRPLVIVLNLMPTKIATETQLLRLLSNSPLQIEIDFLQNGYTRIKNTPSEHLATFYTTFDEIKDSKYDGMIITGAPVENLEYEDVDYWGRAYTHNGLVQNSSLQHCTYVRRHLPVFTIITVCRSIR